VVDHEAALVELEPAERLVMMWAFRHFDRLPQSVLSPLQQQIIWRAYRYNARATDTGALDMRVIGTVEQMFPPVRPAEGPQPLASLVNKVLGTSGPLSQL
jgi:hypothetical protein